MNEIVDLLLADHNRLEERQRCYISSAEVVRLCISNDFKRMANERSKWVVGCLECFLSEIMAFDRASANGP